MSRERRYLKKTWLAGLIATYAPVWFVGLVHAGLYECRDASGAPIYTDSPAQLEQCQPVASGGTSRLGLVGGASHSGVQAPELPHSVTPPIPPMPSGLEPSMGVPSGGLAPSNSYPGAGLAPAQAETPPCVPGINPLNPLSGPPCPSETSPPAGINLPIPLPQP